MAPEEAVAKLQEAVLRDGVVVVDLLSAMLRAMASLGGHGLNDEEHVRALLRARFMDALSQEDHVYLLAPAGDRHDELAGLVEASVVSPCEVFRPKPMLHVHALYVRPSFRGRGFGRRLLEAAIAWGRRRGCVEAELNVLAGNPARELYAELGFDVCEMKMRLAL